MQSEEDVLLLQGAAPLASPSAPPTGDGNLDAPQAPLEERRRRRFALLPRHVGLSLAFAAVLATVHTLSPNAEGERAVVAVGNEVGLEQVHPNASWQCYRYGEGQDDTWCRSAGKQGGWEYKFVGEAGVEASVCGECWCCSRHEKDDDFECEADKSGWSDADKAYCCETNSDLCEFDCSAFAQEWKTVWSDAKKAHCCKQSEVLCEEAPAEEAPAEVEEAPVVEAPVVAPVVGQCGQTELGVVHKTEYTWGLPDVATIEDCCARCIATERCVAWTWVTKAGFMSGPDSACYIRAGVIFKSITELAGVPLSHDVISGTVPRPAPTTNGTVNMHIFYMHAVHSGNAPPACPAQGAELPAVPQHNVVGLELRVLNFNLEWWSNFNIRQPAWTYPYLRTQTNPAIELLKRNLPFDVMAFQECIDVNWVLLKAGMSDEYEGRQGPEEVCIAWKKTAWQFVADGFGYVSEDHECEYWRRRGAQWVRLQHMSSKQNLLFLNHHGPLPLHTGGTCGGRGTAINLLSLAAAQAEPGDAVLFSGDFNAGRDSETVQTMSQRLKRNAFGTSFGGVDNLFSNLEWVDTKKLGTGGSDHDALSVTFKM